MASPTLLRTFGSTLAALLLLTTCARAVPSIRYSWDACDPVVLDHEFVGPGHYVQTLSVTGLVLPFTSFEAHIAIGPGLLSAWAFYNGACQGAGRMTVSTAAGGCQTIPGLLVTANVVPGLTDPTAHLYVTASVPAGFTPDPTARYTLLRIDFDHTATTTGSLDPPGHCGSGDLPYCFGIESMAINAHSLPGRDFDVENGVLTWNLASTPGQCPFRVAVRPSTWGRLKSIYR